MSMRKKSSGDKAVAGACLYNRGGWRGHGTIFDARSCGVRHGLINGFPSTEQYVCIRLLRDSGDEREGLLRRIP